MRRLPVQAMKTWHFPDAADGLPFLAVSGHAGSDNNLGRWNSFTRENGFGGNNDMEFIQPLFPGKRGFLALQQCPRHSAG